MTLKKRMGFINQSTDNENNLKIGELVNILMQFNPKDELIFYYLKDHNLTGCQLESVMETELGAEITIEEIINENDQQQNND